MRVELLGKKVRCIVSGFEGIATAVHNFLNGCERVTVQQAVDKDGKLPEEKWFDVDQVEVIGDGVKVKRKETGGPVSSTPPKF